MKKLASVGFVIAGLINLLPVIGVAGVSQLNQLYGIGVSSAEMAVLLMHRAVLLGIVGALLVAASFLQQLRLTAAIAGLVSMGAYVLLIFFSDVSNPALSKIARVDVGAMIILFSALIAHFRQARISPN